MYGSQDNFRDMRAKREMTEDKHPQDARSTEREILFFDLRLLERVRFKINLLT